MSLWCFGLSVVVWRMVDNSLQAARVRPGVSLGAKLSSYHLVSYLLQHALRVRTHNASLRTKDPRLARTPHKIWSWKREVHSLSLWKRARCLFSSRPLPKCVSESDGWDSSASFILGLSSVGQKLLGDGVWLIWQSFFRLVFGRKDNTRSVFHQNVRMFSPI
jgi:hypothetical protein